MTVLAYSAYYKIAKLSPPQFNVVNGTSSIINIQTSIFMFVYACSYSLAFGQVRNYGHLLVPGQVSNNVITIPLAFSDKNGNDHSSKNFRKANCV